MAPKRRIQHVFQPRKTHWTEDENKFGQKLLEKMGWKKGKGLGKDLGGNPESIKVAFKADTRGVGFKDRINDVWMESNFQYEQLLQELNKQHGYNDDAKDSTTAEICDRETLTENEEASEESRETQSATDSKELKLKLKRIHKKSKKLKKPIRYRKFVHAKDLSRYSEKDLKAIFAVKPTENEEKASHIESQSNENSSEEEPQTQSSSVDEVEESNPGFIKQQLSVQDYFAQKLAAKRNQKPTRKSYQYPNADSHQEIQDDANSNEEVPMEEEPLPSKQGTPSDDDGAFMDDSDDPLSNKAMSKCEKGRVRFSLSLESIKFFDKTLPPSSVASSSDDDE